MPDKAADFLSSFYGMWFQSLPEQVVCDAIDEVSNQYASLKCRCPRLFDEYVRLQTVMLLLTFTNVGNLEIEVDGQPVQLKSLADSGAVAYVKKDSIDSSISREYHKPVLPDGMSQSDFPLGRIKDRIAHIEKACSTKFIRRTGFNSGVYNCGMG
jgi:hypothetical protein